MNPDLERLQPYPFEKLNALKAAVQAPAGLKHIALSIGEPKHAPPPFVLQCLKDNLDKVANYPKTRGPDELRDSIAGWATQRFRLAAGSLDASRHVLPVNGTREALFAFTQTVIERSPGATVVAPNPFYQIYEGAAYLAGAELAFVPCLESHAYQPDFTGISAAVWQRCQLLFLCSPGNPTGAVLPAETLKTLIELADRYDFVIASDECYSELYFNEQAPPMGLLQACAELGRDDFKRCMVFHSLSKRSNLPGLRSGFVAGDAELIERFLLYRTYHGCAMPEFTAIASTAAWQDESHVQENRAVYRHKFERVLEELDGCLEVTMPDASFYLWPKVPCCDQHFAQQLFAQQNVTVLPGQFLSREVAGLNPGANHVRMALVAPVDECIEAAQRIRRFVEQGAF